MAACLQAASVCRKHDTARRPVELAAHGTALPFHPMRGGGQAMASSVCASHDPAYPA